MRTFRLLAAAVLMLGLMVGPAAAHNLEVAPHGTDEVHTGWVGSGALPANAEGAGLIPGGPTGSYMQSPSHGSGLNTACEQNEANPSVVDIRGPAAPHIEDPECPHGS